MTGSAVLNEGLIVSREPGQRTGFFVMYVRRFRASVAIAVVAASVSVWMLPMAAEAFHVIWPRHETQVSESASGWHQAFKALATKPRAFDESLNKAGLSSRVNGMSPTFVAARTTAAEPVFGQIFASVSSFGSAAVSLSQDRSALSTQSVTDKAAKAEVIPVSLTTALPSVQRDLGDETLEIALLFSGSPTVSDKQLVHLLSGQAGKSGNQGRVESCDGGQACSIAAAPIPGAIWLMVSALVGLMGVGYRRRGVHPAPAA